MADEGFTIGSHSMSHPKLGMLNPRLIEEQIVDSSMIIREITGASTIPFSFPNSAGGIDRKNLSRIRTRNPYLGLFFDTQNIQQDVNFMVNRIWVERYIREHDGITLPALLHSVYVEEALDNLRRFRGISKFPNTLSVVIISPRLRCFFSTISDYVHKIIITN
jgi:peptidoglycan/xylan/chitin deacetylase (PgdA/CDA1 family)